MPLTPDELLTAVATLTLYLDKSGVRFSISGGVAAFLLRQYYNIETRTTDNIDLVVQPNATFNAESLSRWLYEAPS